MSVVLIGPSGSLGRAVFERMRGQGDDIRVVEGDPVAAEEWKRGGAFVAQAREWDADLIERASYEARTIVVFPRDDDPKFFDELVIGAGAAAVDRIILLTQRAAVPEQLEEIRTDHVVIAMGKRSRLRRSTLVDDDRVAEAIDAADDLAGHPRLLVDLTKGDGGRLLGI